MWLDHGYAWISVNYRGSTTFGKAFEEQIIGDVGHWEVEDMAAATRWLIDEGIAEPDAILLTGWSYGGYLTLHGLHRKPDLWAGGMGGVVVADWALEHEEAADALKAYDVGLFGGTASEKRELYDAASPLTYADALTKPLLIIQGENDTRCPPEQVRVYEAKMKELGKPVEVFWFDTGHGSNNVEESISHYEMMLKFAFRVLG
jgi:dipeptidyl aminopeptidase/acylaminoacyl peptidase